MFTEFPLNDWRTPSEDFGMETIEEPVLNDQLSEEEPLPDFSEYMWMENEEEFDKTEMERLEEEYRMRECIAAMLADELDEHLTELEKATEASKWIDELMAAPVPIMGLDVAQSQLNPLAKEFVPNGSEIN